MTVTAITLTDPVSGLSVPILPADGVAAQVLDVAAPARVVAEDKVGAHGSKDTTRYAAAAAVSLTLLLYPGVVQAPEDFLDAIGPLLAPGLRPALVVANDQWPQVRQLTVRFDSIAKPLSDVTNWPVQVNWAAPGGVWEGAALVTGFVSPFLASATGWVIGSTGLAMTTAGVPMPAASAPSPSIVTSPGAAPSQWTALLYGPCTGPKLANDATGLTLEFTDDVSLAAGDYLFLDSANRAATLSSGMSALSSLSFTTSQWWLMQPGANLIRFYPSAAGGGSQAQLSFRPAWPA